MSPIFSSQLSSNDKNEKKRMGKTGCVLKHISILMDWHHRVCTSWHPGSLVVYFQPYLSQLVTTMSLKVQKLVFTLYSRCFYSPAAVCKISGVFKNIFLSYFLCINSCIHFIKCQSCCLISICFVVPIFYLLSMFRFSFVRESEIKTDSMPKLISKCNE